ncbi:MAG: hypothetical protein MUE91_12935 [Ignavibacteriaceae bacterium]|nr:hypothetical protein [Ignavibacteriaceae bacterium]
MENQEQLRDKVVEWLRTNIKKRGNLLKPTNPEARGDFYSAYARNYPEILDLAFGPVIDTAAENKRKLLEMKDRPKQNSKDPEEKRMASYLNNYTRKKGSSYDSEFHKLIRKAKPQWFIDTAAESKKRLLELKDRPSSTSKDPETRRLGQALGRYTNNSQEVYDPEFDKLIRKVKPEWFVDTATENKGKLLKLRRKPSKHSKDLEEMKLGRALCDYISKTRSSYDPEFDKLIRRVKPEWFIDAAAENKKTLLQLKDKPSRRASNPDERNLANRLRGYIEKRTRGSYDPAFDKLIRKTKPHWFK